MNILRNPNHEICSIIDIKSSTREFESSLMELCKVSDVYINISKRRGICTKKYSHLFPVSGYSSNNGRNSENIISMLDYMTNIVKKYSKILIVDCNGEKSINSNVISKLITFIPIGKSIFNSCSTPHEEKELIYKSKSWMIPENEIGMNCTHVSYGDKLLLRTDSIKILDYLRNNPSYLPTFIGGWDSNYLIPSLFELLDIEYINLPLDKVDV
jgi:hypothetical protein